LLLSTSAWKSKQLRPNADIFHRIGAKLLGHGIIPLAAPQDPVAPALRRPGRFDQVVWLGLRTLRSSAPDLGIA
jgi:SpoVK/Ycf46/Vps4 family AAA+-type ATPase